MSSIFPDLPKAMSLLLDPNAMDLTAPPILLVDDNAINLKVMERQLKALGFSVDKVSNGLDALERLSETRYQLVLMDCQMPYLDGYNTTRCLRIQEGTERHTAVVAVTANAGSDNRQLCLEAGMDDFISKPVTMDALSDTVNRWLPTPQDLIS